MAIRLGVDDFVSILGDFEKAVLIVEEMMKNETSINTGILQYW